MRVFACLLAASLTAGIVQASEPAGVYGWIHQIVPEPNRESPRRLQVWGTFCVAVGASGEAYTEPEHGYLYFELPSDSNAALKEYADLQSIIGQPGVGSFGSRSIRLRVRTSDEKPDRPDLYSRGDGPEHLDYSANLAAVKMLGGLPKAFKSTVYAWVDKVVLEPDRIVPVRIQIWGSFAISDSRTPSSYSAPKRGYPYLYYPHDGALVIADHQMIRFDTNPNLQLQIRDSNSAPSNPEKSPIFSTILTVRPGTEYSPVKALESGLEDLN